jgi:starch synthase
MIVLHAAAELFPHVKVGGLADVMGALPLALSKEGVMVRLLLPAYPALMKVAQIYGTAATFPDIMGSGPARLLLADVPGSVPMYLLDAPNFFARDGGPYDERGDNHRRFAALSWVVALLALNGDAEGFRPDIVHVHDWQMALKPVFISLSRKEKRPKTVLTIHNLTYQGVFPRQVMDEIWLPREAFHMHGAEYFGQINYLKAGLAYADRITTVSPTYAKEILTKEGGCNLEGILRRRSNDIVGILNGVDELVWNPAKDSHLRTAFNQKNLKLNKGYNKKVFQQEMMLNEDAKAPLFGVVSRFDSIKGLDLVISNIDYMVSTGAQLAVIGKGDPGIESAFNEAANRYPGSVAVHIGHDEGKAHRLYAASDMLLTPSRSEPCGLTQLYAMRYGAPPIARKTGGLADTVVDVTPETLKAGTATGFLFFDPDSWHLGEAITRAISLFKSEPKVWEKIQLNAMYQHFTWTRSAQQYAAFYSETLNE